MRSNELNGVLEEAYREMVKIAEESIWSGLQKYARALERYRASPRGTRDFHELKKALAEFREKVDEDIFEGASLTRLKSKMIYGTKK
jgi:hypothetical protein